MVSREDRPGSTVGELDDSRGRVRRLLRWLRGYRGAHVAILLVAAIFLLYESRRLGLYYDDWAFIVPSHVSIWAPHVGHWSTVPMVLFLAIRDVFGLNHFLPFALPVIVVQLGIAHVLWRVMLRIGVTPWLATAASILVAFPGAGAADVLWAFQVGFLGGILLPLMAMLLLARDGFRAWHAVAVAVLTLVAVASSGTSLPMVAGAAIVGVVYRGVWRTIAMLLPCALAYGLWFMLVGRAAPDNGLHANGLADFVVRGPAYVLHMLADGLGIQFGVTAAGAIACVAVVSWAVVRLTCAPREWTIAYACLVALFLFAALTAYTRLNAGIENATSSRYLFMVVALFLPFGTLGLDAIRRRSNLPVIGFVLLIAVVAVYNCGLLVTQLASRSVVIDNTNQRISAALAVAQSRDHSYSPAAQPAAQWAPDVTMRDIEAFVHKGWLAPHHFDEAARLSVEGALFGTAASSTAPTERDACRSVTRSSLPLTVSDGSELYSGKPTTIALTLSNGAVVGDPHTVSITGGWSRIHAPASGQLELASVNTPIELCTTGEK